MATTKNGMTLKLVHSYRCAYEHEFLRKQHLPTCCSLTQYCGALTLRRRTIMTGILTFSFEIFLMYDMTHVHSQTTSGTMGNNRSDVEQYTHRIGACAYLY